MSAPFIGRQSQNVWAALVVGGGVAFATVSAPTAAQAQQQQNRGVITPRIISPPVLGGVRSGNPVQQGPPVVSRGISSFGPGAIPMPTVGAIRMPTVGAIPQYPTRVVTPNYNRYYDNGYGYRYGNGYAPNNYYRPYPNHYRPYSPYYGGVSAVVLPNAIITGNGITYFGGYYPSFITGQTVLSPFAGLYGCPPYIGSSYVVTTPYAYSSGGAEAVTIPVNGASVAQAPLNAVADPLPSETGVATGDAALDAGADRLRVRTLRAALDDLAGFWETDDMRGLRRHLDSDGTVAVYQNDRVAYQLKRADLLGMFEDAQARTETVSFRFTSLSRRDDGLVNAYAEHTYRLAGEGKSAGTQPHVATVRYTLAYEEGAWFLSAVSFAPGNVSH